MPDSAIRAEIQKIGAIPFARFMELALYCPETGYYERNQDNVGRRGDFITSVSTGELFGQLLAFQFGEWLENLKQFPRAGEPLKIVEAGAHDGKLAADILRWLKKNRAGLFSEIEYVLIEPSARRQPWQREMLKEFSNVRWVESQLSTLNSQVTGIIFSNELLDAFPVHRFGWDATDKKWFEWGVTHDGEKFVWAKITNHESRITLPSSLLEVLPDGYIIETSPAAENWWRDAANILTRGKILAIDYGFTSEEQFSPARTNGTLRAYFRQQVNHDLLANVGEQDLTAHVNFSAMQNAGESVGLKTDFFCTQPQFLTRILAAAVKMNEFATLDAKQVRQFQTLTHPEHLGRAFRVLAQSRHNPPS
jgi:SAM-dependent MidA family methyltransferase